MKIHASSKCMAFLAVSGIFFAGCKAPPATENVVIPPKYAKLMKDMEERGLQKAWGEPEIIRKYDKIEIAVNISPVQLQESWWARQNIRNLTSSRNDDMNAIAEYAKDSFIKAFRESKHLKLVDKPGPKTLALEFSIVQLIPNKPVMGAVSNLTNLTPIGLLLAPIKLTAKGVSSESGGVIAMETVIRDSQTGKILGVVAERSKGSTAFFNLKEFTAYESVKSIIDSWTANLALALDQIKEGKKVDIKQRSTWGVIEF